MAIIPKKKLRSETEQSIRKGPATEVLTIRQKGKRLKLRQKRRGDSGCDEKREAMTTEGTAETTKPATTCNADSEHEI